ncbi:MAG: carboxypeptidase regulatory-like domain-containing protein [Thermoanaerobaculia bacterium]
MKRVLVILASLLCTTCLTFAADLDQNCVVSAFNRSARVQADGSWVLPNIPANSGPVRVRATCLENGVTRSGQSDLVNIPPNGTIKIAKINFDAPIDIPQKLVLTTPAVVLSRGGETLQLTATGSYSDGSTKDLSLAETGTSYRSTNAAVASVDANGMVTAHSSGIFLISALNEGALAVRQFQVVLSGDSDGDGLPDDWEVAHGLDPNNPLDALADPDQDGLTNRDEYAQGTDPRNPDTDGDGLLDGREVNELHTNPLLADTDGDGFGDGLEVQTGSNPLDPNSFNLAAALESLTVKPASFTLVFNTAIGEASRRLDVIARLIDGTEIEARSRRYGTSYQSSDLAVANFGVEDGVVFAGQDGTATITVQIGSFSATSVVQVESFSPTALSFLPLPGYPNGVAVSGDYAYVASGWAGLHVVDVSDLSAPVLVGTVDTPGNANDVRVQGTFAYVADGASGLQVIDVSDPTRPRIVGTLDTPGDATDLVVQGDRVYVADGLAGVQVIDIANRSLPTLLGSLDTPGLARGIDVVDNLVVVADSGGGVHVVSVADPAAPKILGSTHTRVTWSRAADVAVRGRLAWVADGADSTLGGLVVVDFTEPSTPVVVGRTSNAYGLVSVALDGGRVLAADYYFVNGVPIFDSDATPALNAVLDFSGAPSFRDDNGNGVAVRPDGAVFLAATSWSILDNGVWGSGGLHIGRYRVGSDDLGVAPEVTLTSPPEGTSAHERTSLTLRAQASDDVHVESVAFLVDGVEVFRDFKRPFEATIRVPVGVSSLRIGAVATDMAGNEGVAKEVTVTVIPNDKPVVSLLAPAADSRLREGTQAEVVAVATDDIRADSVQIFIDGVLRGTFNQPPYRVPFLVPLGASQVTVQVVATDSEGQSTSITEVVPVEDDLPPIVAVVAPAAGAQVIEGSRVVVTVGAADDQGVRFVELSANGVPLGSDSVSPYEFSLQVPTGISELRLTATAEDSLGQRSTAESVLNVVPDPLTTAVGRVLDDKAVPVAGADVRCHGFFGLTDTSGTFSISGLPVRDGALYCTADFTTSLGKTWHAISGPRAPVAGGTTDMGNLQPSPFLLYASFSSLGAVALLDADTLAGSFLDDSGSSGGLSGLAVNSSGRLFATTLEGPPGSSTSRLLELDPGSGAVLAEIGPITDSTDGSGLSVGDLAVQPGSGALFVLRTGEDGHGKDGSLYIVNPANGVASLVGGTGTDGTGGLAFTPNGLLYTTRWDGDKGVAFLRSLDPANGSTLSEVEIASPPGLFRGLTARPTDGLLLGTLQQFVVGQPQSVVAIDPASGLVAEIGITNFGVLEDLALLPLPPPEAQTTVVGRVIDAFGAPVEGMRVTVRNLFESVTGSDGRFALSGVPASFGNVVVIIPPSEFSNSGAESAPTPTVAGGTTDVGDIVLTADEPGTRAVGRVLDDEAIPVVGAEVVCHGYSFTGYHNGTTDGTGTFNIPGVRTLDGRVQCTASFMTPAGELRSALSWPRTPVAGGTTNMGDLRPTPFLLYASAGPHSFDPSGALALLNPDTLTGSRLMDTGISSGFSGLVFDSSNRLFATTLEGPSGGRTSRLVELNPDSGAMRAEIGPVTDGADGSTLSVGDLAAQPETGALFALRTGEDGHGQAGALYTVNPATGVASLLGDTGTDGTGGLAFSPNGELYTTRWNEATGTNSLRTVDPEHGFTLSEVEIASPFSGAFSGLAVRPTDGLVLGLQSDTPLEIDPVSGLAGEIGFPPYATEDLAFRPLPPPQGQTTVVGRLLDASGSPVEAGLVSVLDVFESISQADGRFVISRVPASFGEVLVTASWPWPRGEGRLHSASSAPTPTVAGGTTDVGDLVLQDVNPPTTVVGTVVDELGQPVPGAAIKVFNNSIVLTTTTDASGGFMITNIPGEETLHVLATAEVGGVKLRGLNFVGPQPGGVTDAGPITIYPIEDVPDPLTAATGHVIDSAGLPVAGARVHVFTDWDVFPGTTGTDGSFLVLGIPTVDGDLYAAASARLHGHLATGSSSFFTPEAGGVTNLGEISIVEEQESPPPQVQLGIREDRLLLAILAPPARVRPLLWCPARAAAGRRTLASLLPENASGGLPPQRRELIAPPADYRRITGPGGFR